MNFQARKLKAIAYLVNLEDVKLFSKIEATIIESRQKELSLKPLTHKQMVDRAKCADDDFLAGRIKSQEELELESEKW